MSADLKPYQQDTLRHLLNAFAAAPDPVRREALRQLSTPLRPRMLLLFGDRK